MKHMFRACLLILIVFLAVIGFINAKPNPASLLFNQQIATQNNMQMFSNVNGPQFNALIQQFQKTSSVSFTPASGNGNPGVAGASNLPSVIIQATGNFNPGGTIILTVTGSPSMTFHPFILIFSLSGDYPGLTFPGVGTIPANFPYIASFFGFLGPSGSSQFILQIPNDHSLMGLPLTSAVGVINPFSNEISLSNPVSYTIGSGVVGVSCCTQGVLNGPESQCISEGVSVNYCRLNTEGAVQDCIPQDVGVDPAPTNISSLQPGNVSAGSSFITNLTRDIGLSNITRRTYNNLTYDCDDFADDLEQWLQGLGYNATFTQFVKYVGNTSTIDYIHAVIDIHLPDGSTIWVEPQTGAIINLDFDGDGNVEANVNEPYRNGHHPTDDNAKIYVYDSAAGAAANGAPRD
ncbi:MAG: hypothetical protein AABX94_01210 [Nanoarchaeota archaeon]